MKNTYSTDKQGLLRIKGYKRTEHLSMSKDGTLNQSYSFEKQSSPLFSILCGVMLFLLAFSLISSLTGTNNAMPFTSLLESLTTMPQINTDWLNAFEDVSSKLGDWGVFNFFRDFLQVLAKIVQVVLFICTALAQLIVFLVSVVKLLFTGSPL